MKICKNCAFHTRKGHPVSQNPDGTMNYQMVSVCAEPNNVDPVEGQPLPCQFLRQNESFCGIKGLRFKQADTTKEETPKGKIIEISG